MLSRNEKSGYLASYKPGMQFLFLILIIIISLVATTLLTYLISYLIWGDAITTFGQITKQMSVAQIRFLKLSQFLSQLGLFVIPAIVFSKLLSNQALENLNLKQKAPISLFLLGVTISVLSLPLISWMLEVNMNMHFPESMSGIEAWMIEKEEMGVLLTETLLSDTSISGLIINLIVIAVMAALGEELLFRGVLLKFFARIFSNVHWANFLTAFIFAFIHFQFFGFLPRFFMGILLGYLFIWSGSLWIPILVHFLNNAIAVFVAFLYKRGDIATSYEDFGTLSSKTQLLICVVAFLVFAFVFRRNSRQREFS